MTTAVGSIRNDDGCGFYYPVTRDHPEMASSVAFVFKTGEIWAANSYLLTACIYQGERFIPNAEKFLVDSLESYGKCLSMLGMSPPYKWIAGMEDLENRSPYITAYSRAWFTRNQHLCVKDMIVEDGNYSRVKMR
jgi:hypothetical protein